MTEDETKLDVEQEKDPGWGLYRFGFLNTALAASVTVGVSAKGDNPKEPGSAEAVAAYLEAINRTMNGVL